MIVLSLFDGISCGQLALKRAGIKVDKYYASEIDQYAISITNRHFKDTTQLGNVINVDRSMVNKDIDLLIGGSPCQGFSFAGKQLNFNDPRSSLFFEYVRILREFKPRFFLLENVKMKKEYSRIISDALGVDYIEINSNLVSAQNRIRYYWTNIENIPPLVDKNIYIRDILESSVSEKYFLSDKLIAGFKRKLDRYKLTGKGFNRSINIRDIDGKSSTLTARYYKMSCSDPYILDNGRIRRFTPAESEKLQNLPYNYTNGISDMQRYKTIGNCWTVDVIANIFRGIIYK